MPYIDPLTYEMIPRTTEVLGGLECENKAYLHPINRMARGETKNPRIFDTFREVALKGTLAHHEMENWIRNEYDLAPITLDLTPSDKKEYVKVMKNTNRLKTMMDEVKLSFDSFLNWWEHFNPTPIFVEKTMVYMHYERKKLIPKKSIKGTIDFVGSFDPEEMSEYAYSLLPIGKESIMMADWKSGVSKMPSYEGQIQAYHWTADKVDIWKDLPSWAKDLPRSTTGATVLFGKKATRKQEEEGLKGWQFARYDNLNTYNMWMKAREIFFSPQPVVTNSLRSYAKDWRESYGCNFCPHTYSNLCDITTTRETTLLDTISLMKGDDK